MTTRLAPVYKLLIVSFFALLYTISTRYADSHDEKRLRNKPLEKHYYILGLESSGTRYLSRGVGVLLDPASTWNGEHPAKLKIGHQTIQHVSLPWGSTCKGKIDIVRGEAPIESKRWFLNVTAALLGHPERKAIVIVRDRYFQQRSVQRYHCSNEDWLEEETNVGLGLLREATTKLPRDQLLVISYESFHAFPDMVWGRVATFLGMPVQHGEMVSNAMPFRNGNVMY